VAAGSIADSALLAGVADDNTSLGFLAAGHCFNNASCRRLYTTLLAASVFDEAAEHLAAAAAVCVQHDLLGRPRGPHRRRGRSAGAATREPRLLKAAFTPPSPCGSRAAAIRPCGHLRTCCGMVGHGWTGPRRRWRRRRAGGVGDARR